MRSASLFAAGLLCGLLLTIGIQGRTQDWLVGSGLVRHLNGGGHCNDRVTPGFGVEISRSANARVAAGIYDNSNCRVSSYAAYVWTPLHYGRLHVGALAGGVTGYSQYPVLPALALTAAYEARRWGVNLIYIPPFGDYSANIAWLQVKIPWR